MAEIRGNAACSCCRVWSPSDFRLIPAQLPIYCGGRPARSNKVKMTGTTASPEASLNFENQRGDTYQKGANTNCRLGAQRTGKKRPETFFKKKNGPRATTTALQAQNLSHQRSVLMTRTLSSIARRRSAPSY